MKKNPVWLTIGIALIVVSAQTVNAQWVQTNGPGGSSITALAVSGSFIFAGTMDSVSGGVFLSTDSGTTWTTVNSGLFAVPLQINALAAPATSGIALFAGTSEGIFRSYNNGTSWTPTSSGLPYTAVVSFAVSGGNIFAGTSSAGVFLSTNDGAYWTAVNNGLTNHWIHSLAMSGGNLFAGTEGGGVFLSANNGTNWTAVNNGLTNPYIHSLAASGGTVFAGTDSGVFLSTNNGTSWTAVNAGLTNKDVLSLAVSGSTIFAGTKGGGVFCSTNNGTNWSAFNSGISNLSVFSLAVCGNNIFAGTYRGGVWRMPLSEIVGIINPNPHQGMLKPYASGFKIKISKNGIAVSLPETLNNGAIAIGLFTIAGKRIYSATHQINNGSLNIPLTSLSRGTYLMSITGKNGALRSSFVMMK